MDRELSKKCTDLIKVVVSYFTHNKRGLLFVGTNWGVLLAYYFPITALQHRTSVFLNGLVSSYDLGSAKKKIRHAGDIKPSQGKSRNFGTWVFLILGIGTYL